MSEHKHIGGSAGGPGECSAECACGTTFAGFDTHAEVTALLDQHISDANAELKLAAERAAGFRALADLIEANPQLASDLYLQNFLAMPLHNPKVTDQRARLAEWATAALGQGAKFTKRVDKDHFSGIVDFGPFSIEVLADRDEVCERVVTGTETVTKKVKDPEALAAVPEIEVTEEVETVEWVCRPLLAATGGES